jgi:hypothetical protein
MTERREMPGTRRRMLEDYSDICLKYQKTLIHARGSVLEQVARVRLTPTCGAARGKRAG